MSGFRVRALETLALGWLSIAACGGESTSPPTVATVEVTPASATLEVLGAVVQFQVSAKDADGNALTGHTFTWSSTATGVATVNAQSGLATAVANGTAEIRATTEGITSSATLTVAEPARSIRGMITVSNAARLRARPDAAKVTTGTPGLKSRRGAKRLPAWAARVISDDLGRLAAPARRQPSVLHDELLVTFKAAALSAPQAGSMAYTAPATAKAVRAAMTNRLASLTASGRMIVTGASPAILATRIKLRSATELDAVANELRADPAVAHVERHTRRFPLSTPLPWGASSAALGPNDRAYPLQAWHYTMIDLPRAWALSTGSPSVVVAVIDDGINPHPDILPNLASGGFDFVSNDISVPICGGTIIGAAGDGDGYDPNPTSPAVGEVNQDAGCVQLLPIGNHGLHVAGTIGAKGNDGLGVTGVNWTVRIRPIRVIGLLGGMDYDIAQGILYAAGLPADDGAGGQVQAPSAARIINMSLGGPGSGAVVQAAVTAATNAGSLIIAAAGNDSTSEPNYPAAYPEVLSVSAVGPDRELASYSSFGTTVDIAAPGGDISDGGESFGVISTDWNFAEGAPTYKSSHGTSMASPHVAGVAALLLAHEPGLTATELRSRLESFAVDIGPAGRDNQFGVGLVNARNSLTESFAPAQSLYARVVDAASGIVLGAVAVAVDGSYEFPELGVGSYHIFAGQDEESDGLIGVPVRRWSAFGGSARPAAIDLSEPGEFVANFSVGLPVEHEPNNGLPEADLLPLGGYLVGTIGSPGADLDVTGVHIPTAGQYTFETSGPGGACGFALEEDTILELLDVNGISLAVNDNQDTDAALLCSKITQQLPAGTYYLAVHGFAGSGLNGRRYAVSARLEP